jgi:hypothetical protein
MNIVAIANKLLSIENIATSKILKYMKNIIAQSKPLERIDRIDRR